MKHEYISGQDEVTKTTTVCGCIWITFDDGRISYKDGNMLRQQRRLRHMIPERQDRWFCQTNTTWQPFIQRSTFYISYNIFSVNILLLYYYGNVFNCIYQQVIVGTLLYENEVEVAFCYVLCEC